MWCRDLRSLIGRSRMVVGLAVLIAVAGAGVALVPALRDVAEASNCGGRCYANGEQGSANLAGIKASWDIQDLAIEEVEGVDPFILQDLWGVTDEAGEMRWVEVGYRRGWPSDHSWVGFFWAERVDDSYGYKQYRITSPTPGAIGTTNEFKIDYTGDVGSAHSFNVYINGSCVQTETGAGCGSNQWSYIVRQIVGAEATWDTFKLGPTHVFGIQNRSAPSGGWVNWQPAHSTSPSLSNSMFEWTGDYNNAVYAEGIPLDGQSAPIKDSFDESDGSDPSSKWPKTSGYWSESGGNIFVHKEANTPRWSHLHGAYDNASGYLLMRRDKGDSYTGSPIVLEFSYGEDLASQAGRFFGVWSGSSQMAIGVNTGHDPTWSPNYYFYRVSNSTALINTGIARTGGWHTFRFYVTSSGCSYGELDGTSLASLGTNCSITPGTLNKWGIASTWGLTDPPNLDAIWDNAVYFHR